MFRECVIAFEDVVNIFSVKGDYGIVTIDGKTHRIRVPKNVIDVMIQKNGNILLNAAYKDYKDKIETFKTTGRKI